MPMLRKCAGMYVMSIPRYTMAPEVGKRKPATICRSVVLPEPLGPRMVRNSPRRRPSSSCATASAGAGTLLARRTLGEKPVHHALRFTAPEGFRLVAPSRIFGFPKAGLRDFAKAPFV